MPQLAIDGMVIDETLTKHGRDFYDVFYTEWSAPEEAYNYTIRIKEQPGRGRRTIIAVHVNDQIVYQSQLSPGYNAVRQAAAQATQRTHQVMQRYDLSRKIY